MPSQQRNQAGFTLIELLVSMAVLAMLSLMMTSGLRLGLAAWERTTTRTGYQDDLAMAQGFVRRTLEHAVPLLQVDDVTSPSVVFVGREDTLQFLAPSPQALEDQGLTRYHLHVAGGPAQRALVVDISLERVDPDTDDSMTTHVVLSGIEAITLSYFGKKVGDLTADWHSEWQERSRLPDLVRIKGRPADATQPGWPALTMRLRVDGDASCVIDPITRYCKGR